jgi:hypothetical protein
MKHLNLKINSCYQCPYSVIDDEELDEEGSGTFGCEKLCHNISEYSPISEINTIAFEDCPLPELIECNKCKYYQGDLLGCEFAVCKFERKE